MLFLVKLDERGNIEYRSGQIISFGSSNEEYDNFPDEAMIYMRARMDQETAKSPEIRLGIVRQAYVVIQRNFTPAPVSPC